MKMLLLIVGLLLTANLFAKDEFSLYLMRNSLSQISDFSFLPSTVTKSMLAQLPEIKWDTNPTKYFIFPMKGKIYALRDGFFDVLVWRDST